MTRGPSKARFEEIFQQGKRVSGGLLRIVFLPGKGSIGITTSRSIGSKPRRNKQKRRVREALKTHSDLLCERLDYILVLFPAIEDAPYPSIRQELDVLLRKVMDRWASEWVSS